MREGHVCEGHVCEDHMLRLVRSMCARHVSYVSYMYVLLA